MTGKAAASDLASRKKSLPIVPALRSGTPTGDELARLYGGTNPLAAHDVARAAALVERSGGRAWSESEAKLQIGRALADLDAAGVGGRGAVELRALAKLVTSRDR